MTSILFICHGNICRSTMAEFVLKDIVQKRGVGEQFHIESAGTSREEIGSDTHHGTRRVLDKHGVGYTKRAARQVTPRDYEGFDLLVCMDSQNLRNLARIIRNDHDGKISKLLDFTERDADIADPWYTGNFDETYADVVQGCEGLLRHLGY